MFHQQGVFQMVSKNRSTTNRRSFRGAKAGRGACLKTICVPAALPVCLIGGNATGGGSSASGGSVGKGANGPQSGRPPGDASVFNPKILEFGLAHVGTQVGNGECWTLAAEALDYAGAKPPSGYVFGDQVPL